MYCQSCGVEAPTKYVSYHQNIGALVMRFSKSVQGNLCRNCVHKHFWSLTGTTAVLGWWGVISLIVTPFFLVNNIVRFAGCLGMPLVPPDAVPPQLDDAAVERIKPHAQRLFERLNEGEDLKMLVTDTAERAGVTPGQVMRFCRPSCRPSNRSNRGRHTPCAVRWIIKKCCVTSGAIPLRIRSFVPATGLGALATGPYRPYHSRFAPRINWPRIPRAGRVAAQRLPPTCFASPRPGGPGTTASVRTLPRYSDGRRIHR